ncbi:hypothetical protein BJ165DRAFT_1535023 [Panaeolus papilionaceus]|nr:hypothetical protein BJ165DRAFT_1535023 [Panaeolus papilionaceus]
MILKNLDDLRESEDGTEKLSAPLIFVTILYFQPITDIRMAGSKRDAVKLLRVFAQLFNGQGITVVTTMWNNLSTAQRIEEANHRFESLKKEIFAPSDKFWIEVAKFEYTMHSALSSLDTSYWGLNLNQSISGDMIPRYQSIIRQNLLHHIINAQQRLDMLAEDKRNATTEKERLCLLEVVLEEESAVLNALHSFLDDLYEIDPSSCSSRLPPLSLRVALKYRFRRFAVTGKRLF